jgi:hypothetical protein
MITSNLGRFRLALQRELDFIDFLTFFEISLSYEMPS